jgi:hypothetical protein
LPGKLTVARGIGLTPPPPRQKKFGPPPMMSRMSRPWAWAWPAPASKVNAANNKAMARIIFILVKI